MPSANLTPNAATCILSQYPGIEGAMDDFGLMPQGLFNENARLVVGGQIFVLKKMAANRSLERHRFGAMLQKVLAAKGFPCPAVMTNQDDDVITAYDGNLWSIQTWAGGSHCLPQWQDGPQGSAMRSGIGSAVGKLHALAMEAQAQGELPPAPEDAKLALSGMLARVDASAKKLFSGSLLRPSQAMRLKLSPGKSALKKEISSMLPTLEKGCRQLQGWNTNAFESLSVTGPCHGDINWENLFFQEVRLTAVLDFDNAMEMSTAFDAVAAAAVVCGNNAEYQKAFWAAYDQAGGITIEQEAIPPLMLLKYVRSLLWQVGVALSGGTGNDALARKWMGFLAKNIEHLLKA